MSIQIMGTKKCKDTQKALRYFKERGVQVHFRDLNDKALSKGELDKICQKIKAQDLIDESSSFYKKKGLAYMEYDPREELLEHPDLVKTPIVRSGSESILGVQEALWKTLI
ncbi:arsenate reductase family protein [Spirochaeta cellobiosiphila]|uniref:arsenate reductase family protein n=1 Tax=Spirochaeta cellobiosiphila TaxID=504483 RepID=UPI0004175ACA|nr:hypothetical protein [Spirochaeta cellobiosiphila]